MKNLRKKIRWWLWFFGGPRWIDHNSYNVLMERYEATEPRYRYRKDRGWFNEDGKDIL